MWRWRLASFCLLISISVVCFAGEVRTWTDKTGKHKIEAELMSAKGGVAVLRKADGATTRVPFDKLSEADRRYLENLPNAANGNDGGGDIAAGKGQSVNGGATYKDLDNLIGEQREATFVVSLIEGFLKTSGVSEEDKAKAQQELSKWRELGATKSIRIGNQWLSPDDATRAKQDEIRLIKEAHRLIDVKNDELALDKFLEASRVNPEAVRADFYLGLLNALVAHHPHDADDHFKECVRRLAKEQETLAGARRANFVAALNNLAIIQVRMRQYRTAISLWRRALEIAPMTPELVQNLGLMSELAQTAQYVNVGREQRNKAGELYAKSTVENGLARFDQSVGWLFIPYVDAVDGTMDSDSDEELVTVGWCTGFSVGGEYLITSRYPVEEADRIVAREGGNTFEASKGKVVALSDDSHLVVVRIDGLEGKQLPLNLVTPRPAQDVTIIGYGSPGLMNENLHKRVATILDPPHFYQNVDVVVQQRLADDVNVFVHTRGVRQLLMHDAITNAALEGAPLIDKKGAVVGVHLGNRPQFGRFGSKHSWAESGAYVMNRITSVTSEVNFRASGSESATPLDDAAVEKLVTGSIFQLQIQRRAPRLAWSHRIEEVHRLQQQGDGHLTKIRRAWRATES